MLDYNKTNRLDIKKEISSKLRKEVLEGIKKSVKECGSSIVNDYKKENIRSEYDCVKRKNK